MVALRLLGAYFDRTAEFELSDGWFDLYSNCTVHCRPPSEVDGYNSICFAQLVVDCWWKTTNGSTLHQQDVPALIEFGPWESCAYFDTNQNVTVISRDEIAIGARQIGFTFSSPSLPSDLFWGMFLVCISIVVLPALCAYDAWVRRRHVMHRESDDNQ